MAIFEDIDAETKKKLVIIWKTMSKQDRDHFINQVALTLTILNDVEKGKKLIFEILHNMLEDGSKNLADIGLYFEFLDEDTVKEIHLKKILSVMGNYRFKQGLPSEPNKEFLFNDL